MAFICEEFLTWIDRVTIQVPTCRLDANVGRGKGDLLVASGKILDAERAKAKSDKS